jgi:moderate conductance mechanosensitive channel
MDFGNLNFGGLDLNDPDIQWRLGISVAIGLAALGVIVWFGFLRGRLKRQAQEHSPTPGKKKAPGGIAHQLVSLAVILGAGWLIAEIWDIDVARYLARERGISVNSIVRALAIVTVAALGIELTNFAARGLIDRFAKRKGADRRRAAKMRTVAPLISGLVNAVIMLAAIAMLLSEAGVEVAPLLAGAGVAGIAIGFGAQSLVKDLFTGAFLIIEDIVSHGDIVEIGGVSGVVEAMTLRTIRVRSFDGTLHIYPYGEALVIHNKTSSFSCFAFELQVSYLSDIDVAMKVLRETDREIRAGKELDSCIIGPLDLPGVDRLHDNGVILKGRIRTMPGESAKVGSAFLKRAKEKLDEAGVLISHRHQAVPPFEFIKDQVIAPAANGRETGGNPPAPTRQ